MLKGQTVSQWITGDSYPIVPSIFKHFGAVAIIEDVTGESVNTLESDPNFVVNDVTATAETWQLIDDHPDIQVLYYG